MACGSVTPAVQRALTALPNIAAYEWFTAWIPCTSMDKFLAVLKSKAVSGNFRAQVVAQYATVRTSDPDAPTAYGSQHSGAGEWEEDSGSITGTTTNKFFVRFGVKYDLSTGSTPATADVELQVAYLTCGQVIPARAEQLTAITTTPSFIAVTGWLSALHAEKLKAAVIVNSLTGNFQWRMAYRTATTSTESPGAWNAGLTSPQVAGEFNTGELSPTVTGKMWVQIGIQYELSTGTTPGTASISVNSAVYPA